MSFIAGILEIFRIKRVSLDEQAVGLQAYNEQLSTGLVRRGLPVGTVEVDGGAGGATYLVQVAGQDISAAIAFDTDFPTTASLISASINLRSKTTGFFATVAGAVVSIRPLSGKFKPGTLATTVAGGGSTTDTPFTNAQPWTQKTIRPGNHQGLGFLRFRRQWALRADKHTGRVERTRCETDSHIGARTCVNHRWGAFARTRNLSGASQGAGIPLQPHVQARRPKWQR